MNGSNIGARLCETVRTASSHPDEPSESGVWSGGVEPLDVLPHLGSNHRAIPWVHTVYRLADAHTVSWTLVGWTQVYIDSSKFSSTLNHGTGREGM